MTLLASDNSANAQSTMETIVKQDPERNNHSPSDNSLSDDPAAATAFPITQDAQVLPQPASQGWRFWAVFIPMCVATLLAAVEATVASTALPFIVAELNSGDLYVWIMNGYLLTRYDRINHLPSNH